MSEITDIEIKKMTKEQNYIRGYKDGREDAIEECKQLLKILHTIRAFEDDFDAKIETPFYQKLWKKMEQLKEK